ncbi:unnamed protein product [Notodromas monacha]|uniref:SAM domain-containing protein n=1 Tax=Notodromas monacha TaxID=399045 RepID=A0A7R9BRJ9_9CRUS|nr:unnamed protein product [Notodromas monacha]CAG0918868.1 unnamed protein product [Notodromas monacha]
MAGMNMSMDGGIITILLPVDRQKLHDWLEERDDNIDGASKARAFFDSSFYFRLPIYTWGLTGLRFVPKLVTGAADSISLASDRILGELEPLSNPNRVSLKMEVSWTEHSHIIGREGRSIKSVSTVTNCHIHFPDSNRFSETEKCNQVSIAGDPQNVETARAQVRNLSPLIFAFEVPFSTDIQAILESKQSPQMLYIQSTFNVQIIVRNKGRPGTVALVKGNAWELEKVKIATRALMNHLCQGESEVMMYMEISPHYHSSVLGNNGASLVRAIMAVTGTMISWPNLSDTSLHPLRKSTFVVSGLIDKGSLPLILMSDLPPGMELDVDQVQHVMTSMKVTVSTRPKNKNGVLHRTLVIRGVERFADRLYEARRVLLGLPVDARVHTHIPESYHVPPLPPSIPLQGPSSVVQIQSSGGMHYGRFTPDPPSGGLMSWYPPPTPPAGTALVPGFPFFSLSGSPEQEKMFNPLGSADRRIVNSASKNVYPVMNGSPEWNNADHMNSNYSAAAGLDSGTSSSFSSSGYSLFSSSMTSNGGVTSSLRLPQSNGCDNNSFAANEGLMNAGMDRVIDYNARKAMASRAMSQEVSPDVPRTPTASWSGMGFSKSHSALMAMNRFGCYASEEKPKGGDKYDINGSGRTSKNEEDKREMSPIPESRSNVSCRVSNTSGSLSSMGSVASSQTLMGSYADRGSSADYRSSWSDWENDESSATDLFRQGTPTNSTGDDKIDSNLSSAMSSLTLSRAMDSNNNTSSAEQTKAPVKTESNFIPRQHISFSASNMMDAVVPMPRTFSGELQDLCSVLTHLNLSKYIESFRSQDIDLQTFITLTEDDLVRLGISTFGARRKILVAIQELRKQGPVFCGSAAVGAERRPSVV